MRTVTKLGAYGLAVAAAFAVAFAVLVTAPRTSVVAQTTDPTPDGTSAATNAGLAAITATPEKRAGDKVYIQVTTDANTNDNLFRFTIDPASGAAATFTARNAADGGQAVNCKDERTSCDRDPSDDQVTVEVQIDADAAANTSLIINAENLNQTGTTKAKLVVEVIGTALATTKLEVELVNNSSLSRPSVGTEGTFDDEAQFQVRVLDNQQPTPMIYAGRRVLITVTRGLLRTSGLDPNCSSVTTCNVTTDDGQFWTQVRGSGEPGPSTLTLTVDGFTATKTITFYGSAKKIAAEAEQNSVQLGGSVFIVATVTDGAGNGVSGHTVAVGSGNDRVKGPSDNAVVVQAVNNVEKDVTGTANDLPACSEGTNNKGKCVIQVTAQNPTGTDSDAARGTHTVTVQGSTPIATADRKVKVEIAVSGAAASVSTNAPARVDPGSTTSITAVVVDDEGVRAGAQSVSVTQISGNGVVRNGGPAVTKNGAHTFTYRAAGGAYTAEFDVEIRATTSTGMATDTGKVLASTSFSIEVGGELVPEPPAQPTAAGITSDAPERVDPGSSTDITVTVTDAGGERAGMQSVTASQVSGDGRIINGGPAATTDGQYTFTFRAAGTTGVAEIDVDVRSLVDGAATSTGRVLATLSLTIQVGEAPAAMASFTPSPAGTQLQITSFSGGSVSDLQGALLDECSNRGVAAFVTTASGFVSFVPGTRLAAPNAAFRALFADGMVPAGRGFIVANCAGS